VARFRLREVKLGSAAEDCLMNAEQCEAVAKHARDTVIRAGLMHAADQWRKRAELLAVRAQPRCAAGERGEPAPAMLDRVAQPQKEL